MEKKLVLIILLSFIFTQQINAQFGLGKAIKNKVEQKTEPQKIEPKVKVPEKTAEEIEAELKKISFPVKAMNDAELEKQMVEVIGRNPGFFGLDEISQLKVLHITYYDWNVRKDEYGNIEGLVIEVYIGMQKADGCYKKGFLFKKNYLGGGQYQNSFLGFIPRAYDYKTQLSCETLSAVVAKDKPTSASKPVTTTTTSSTEKSTQPVKTTITASTSTTKPATTSTSTTATVSTNTMVISLTSLGINAMMTVQKGTEVFKDGDFRIIKNGDVNVQAEVTTLTLAEMKADVKTNDMYNGTGKILASNLNGFIFSCEEEGEDEKRVHLEFFKTIAGKKYRFIDDRMSEQAYTLADLQPFLDALNTIK